MRYCNHNSKNYRAREQEMTYAEYLAKMTVKNLNTIAKDMGLKGYSKLRKAELVAFIDAAIASLVPAILSTEVAEDVPAIVAMMATVPAESVATALESITPDTDTMTEEEELSELLTAYASMKRTWNTATGRTQVRITGQLRAIRAQVKAMGYNPIEVRMGYTIG